MANAAEVADWARHEGFDDLRPEVWHVTVIGADGGKPNLRLDGCSLTLTPDLGREVIRMGGLLVLTVRSRSLSARHARHRRAGGRWDFTSYRPHVSFTLDDGRPLVGIRPFVGPLILGPEVIDRGFD